MIPGKIEQQLTGVIEEKGAAFAVLLDPDSVNGVEFVENGVRAAENGADMLLIGGSFMANGLFSKMVLDLKKEIDILNNLES